MIPTCICCQGAQPYHYKLKKKLLVCVCDNCGSWIDFWPLDDKQNHPGLYCKNIFERIKFVRQLNRFVKEHGWLTDIGGSSRNE